jgi:hypothetical protein
MFQKGSSGKSATAIPAIFAIVAPCLSSKIAGIATIAIAKAPDMAANALALLAGSAS